MLKGLNLMQQTGYYVGGLPAQRQQQGASQPTNQVASVNSRQQQQMQDMSPDAIMQMMQSFGSSGLANVFGSGPLMPMNPFEAFFDFSNLHQQLHQSGEEGTFVVMSQMSSMEMGPDGQPVIESYFENSLGQHKNGNTISEKQQGYQNTAGMRRVAEERMLNQQGRKLVKEKRGNQIEETNHYFNMDPDQVPQFDANWERVNRQNNFLEENGRYLGYQNCGPAIIQMGPPTTYQISGPQNQMRAISGPSMQQSFAAQQPSAQYTNYQNGGMQMRQPPVVNPGPNFQPVQQNRVGQSFVGPQGQGSGFYQPSTLPNMYKPSTTNNRF